MVTCVACKKKQCYRHKMAWHEGYTCLQWDAFLSSNTYKDQLSQRKIASSTKACPKCKLRVGEFRQFSIVPLILFQQIEKNGGCSIMSCSRPRGCGASLSVNLYLSNYWSETDNDSAAGNARRFIVYIMITVGSMLVHQVGIPHLLQGTKSSLSQFPQYIFSRGGSDSGIGESRMVLDYFLPMTHCFSSFLNPTKVSSSRIYEVFIGLS